MGGGSRRKRARLLEVPDEPDVPALLEELPVLVDDGDRRIYKVSGQIFFVSRDEFANSFNFFDPVESVTIDLTNAHLWDQGAVEVLDKTVQKFRRQGIEVEVVGLNQASTTLLNRLATEDELVADAYADA